jgi:photosystem II stability/assembly factor-like uncharacterized protein
MRSSVPAPSAFGLGIRLLLVVAGILAFCTGASAQWVRMNNIPEPYNSNYWLDVFFLPSAPQYGWICGYRSYILRTTDGGATWQGVTVDTNGLQLESIHFVSPNVGYTSGGGRILRTTDGGQSWRDVSPRQFLYYELWGCYFVSADTGVVIGGGCSGDTQNFYRTTNGGQSWSLFQTNASEIGMTDAMLYSGNGLGYAAGSGTVWQTLDGGVSWSLILLTGGYDWQEEITNIGSTFLLPVSGSSCGGDDSRGGIRMTTNNGTTWRRYATGSNMYGAFLLDSLRGWACGGSGSAYYTPDGGRTWKKRDCGISPMDNLDDMFFINDTLGWTVGSGIYKLQTRAALPTTIAVTGPTKFCEGDSVLLSAPTGYMTYHWSTGETSPSIVVRTSGTYFIVATDSLGCPYDFDTVAVTVYKNPSPSITALGPTYFCIGDSVVLEASPGYAAYRWSTGETSRSIVVRLPGTYSVTVEDARGCTGTTESIEVIVRMIRDQLRIRTDADGSIAFDSITPTNRFCRTIVVVNMNDTSSYVLTEAMFAGNVLFSLPQHQFPLFIPAGDSVLLEACYSASQPLQETDTLIIIDNCSRQTALAVGTGRAHIYEAESKCDQSLILQTVAYKNFHLEVYPPFPNPASTRVSIPLIGPNGETAVLPTRCTVYNQFGVPVAEGTLRPRPDALDAGRSDMEIDVSTLVQGLYFALIRTPHGPVTVPLLVQR